MTNSSASHSMYVPTKLRCCGQYHNEEQAADVSAIPSKIQVGSPIEVQFILEHLMDGIGGCSLLRDDKFGNLLLAGIAG